MALAPKRKQLDIDPLPGAPASRPGRPSSRERILAAAVDLVAETGALHFSLDAVAARAGVSKGGLLYNFPSKETLLKALVAHHLVELDLHRAAAEAGLAGGRNRSARAHVTAVTVTCEEPPPRGVLAAFAENPGLFDPMRANQRAFVERLRGADDPVLSMIAFLAVEGLISLDLFESNPLTADERRAVAERLERLLAESRGDPRDGK